MGPTSIPDKTEVAAALQGARVVEDSISRDLHRERRAPREDRVRQVRFGKRSLRVDPRIRPRPRSLSQGCVSSDGLTSLPIPRSTGCSVSTISQSSLPRAGRLPFRAEAHGYSF